MSILNYGILDQVLLVPSLSISPTSGSATYSANDRTITVTSNIDWTAEERSAYSWVSLSTASGSGNGSVVVTFTKNTSSSSRVAYIDIKDSESLLSTKTYTLTQAGCPIPTCNIGGCPFDEPGYLSNTSCSVSSGSKTINFSFQANDITGGGAIDGVVIISGSQSTSGIVRFADGSQTTDSIDVPNNVSCDETYYITICSDLPM